MQSPTKLSERRGFEFSELYAIGVLLVKAPIDLVSHRIARQLQGELEIDTFGKNYGWGLGKHCIVFQYRGHSWTIVFPFNIGQSYMVKIVSEKLQSYCIYLQHEDTSGTSSYNLFDRGTCIEELHWGCDYTEEFLGVDRKDLVKFAEEREAKGDPLSWIWDPRKWDIYCFEGLSSYQFRSYMRMATEEEVKDTDNFLDRIFRKLDAWLPDWEYFPLNDNYNVTAEDLVRVDTIHGGSSIGDFLLSIDED